MRKNVAGQKIGAQMVSATDGSAFTGSVTVSVTVDAGTQATGTVGSGACTHEGNGYHTYAPAQAETNGDLIAFTFTGTGAVPATVQVYTVPTTGLLAPTTADRTVAVEADGMVYADAREWLGTAITAGSIPAAVAGASGGLVIAGTNAPITFTGSGNALTITSTGGNGHGVIITGNGSGTGIDINGGSTGKGVDIAAGTNADAVVIAGNGSGAGVNIDGGATGIGIDVLGGANGIYVASGNNTAALRLLGNGSAAAVQISTGATGAGITIAGGATSGDGVRITTTDGHAISLDASGASKYGLDVDSINVSGTMTVTTNAIAWNSAWDAEVESEANDALIAQNLDHLVKSAVDTNFATTVHLDSVLGQMADNGTTATFDRTTDSLEAMATSGVPAASGGITASSFASGAINAAALAADAGQEIADAVLTRNVSNVESSAGEHTLCTVVLAMLEHSISGTVLTIKRTDGSTTHFAKTITTNASAEPITSIN